MDLRSIANPKSRYGYGKGATRHFIVQRLTGACNVLFLLFFIWLVVRLAGSGRAEMVSLIANPFVGIVTALLLVSITVHMRIGMLEVIEDYVHDEKLNRLSRFLNTAFAVLIALIGILSIAKLVFWG
jgi:succinate dehydrogenase / fumarate reductase membrane anchor subunit